MTQKKRWALIRYMRGIGKKLEACMRPEDVDDEFPLGTLYIFLRYDYDMEQQIDILRNRAFKGNFPTKGRFVPVPEDGSYPFVWVTSTPEEAILNPYVAYCPDFYEDLWADFF